MNGSRGPFASGFDVRANTQCPKDPWSGSSNLGRFDYLQFWSCLSLQWSAHYYKCRLGKLAADVVGIHGGGYKSAYFDADSKHTASIASEAFGVPFVAIDRPCYGSTTSTLPIPLDSSYPDECAKQLHHHILPKAWAEVGIPNDCNCIVLLGHNLGTAVSVAAAILHARYEKTPYPLGGLVVSGLGHQLGALGSSKGSALPAQDTMEFTTSSIKDKNRLMFSSPDTADPAAIEASERMNLPFPLPEIVSLTNVWVPHWRERWASHIVVPVYYALPEREVAFVGTQEHVDECVQALTKSKRVDGSLIPGAPHCMELSCWSSSWYARCFGFAMECAGTFDRAPPQSST